MRHGGNVEFRPLGEVAACELVELFNLPEVRRHLPLAEGPFTTASCETFLAAKERMWDEHGFGPWAFYIDGVFAGWGGLQPEGPEADLGFVLHPRAWGLGAALAREFLRQAFAEMRRASVTVLLPGSRSRVRALARLGFEEDGPTTIAGRPFVRYRAWNPQGVP